MSSSVCFSGMDGACLLVRGGCIRRCLFVALGLWRQNGERTRSRHRRGGEEEARVGDGGGGARAAIRIPQCRFVIAVARVSPRVVRRATQQCSRRWCSFGATSSTGRGRCSRRRCARSVSTHVLPLWSAVLHSRWCVVATRRAGASGPQHRWSAEAAAGGKPSARRGANHSCTWLCRHCACDLAPVVIACVVVRRLHRVTL